MVARAVVGAALASLVTSCAMSPPGVPVVVTGNQPAMLARDRAYVACATALYGGHPAEAQLRLGQGYQSAVLHDEQARLIQITGRLFEDGERKQVAFRCVTERYGRTRVMGISRISETLLRTLVKR